MTETPDTELSNELDALLQRSGLTVPEDRYQAVLAGYIDLKRMVALLRQPRMPAAEPAAVYLPAALIRKV